MKPSRKTTSARTTSRPTRRDAQEDFAAQTLDSPQHASAQSEDQLGATAPLSLQSGAGRQYWDEVLRLFVTIRADCDAAAERLGYVSAKDDGLAAVEYIANKILEAVRGERQQHIAGAKKPSTKKQATTRPPEVQSPTQARPKSDQRARPAQPAGASERASLIGALKQMLRDGKTKAGAVIDPQLAHEIAKHITVLNEAIPETPQAIKRIRDSLARFFGEGSGDRTTPKKPKKSATAAAAAVAEQPKRAKSPSRPKKPNKTVTKRSGTEGSKRSKRRSR